MNSRMEICPWRTWLASTEQGSWEYALAMSRSNTWRWAARIISAFSLPDKPGRITKRWAPSAASA